MRMIRRFLLAASLALPAPIVLAQAQPPLRTAVDGTFAPHAMPKLGGGVEGFNIDLFTEVARRMGREIVIDSASFSGLVPALNAGRYDFLAAPTTVTRERAEGLTPCTKSAYETGESTTPRNMKHDSQTQQMVPSSPLLNLRSRLLIFLPFSVLYLGGSCLKHPIHPSSYNQHYSLHYRTVSLSCCYVLWCSNDVLQ